MSCLKEESWIIIIIKNERFCYNTIFWTTQFCKHSKIRKKVEKRRSLTSVIRASLIPVYDQEENDTNLASPVILWQLIAQNYSPTARMAYAQSCAKLILLVLLTGNLLNISGKIIMLGGVINLVHYDWGQNSAWVNGTTEIYSATNILF